MKNRVFRFFFIGTLHFLAYLYIIPVVVYPGYGKPGAFAALSLTLLLTGILLRTDFSGEDRKRRTRQP